MSMAISRQVGQIASRKESRSDNVSIVVTPPISRPRREGNARATTLPVGPDGYGSDGHSPLHERIITCQTGLDQRPCDRTAVCNGCGWSQVKPDATSRILLPEPALPVFISVIYIPAVFEET